MYGPGEPRLVRDELMADVTSAPGSRGDDLVSLVHAGHVTDTQIADVKSPARFEFLESLRGRPGAEVYVPAWRPQEALVARAVAALVATLNRLPASPETGAAPGLCISTGDNIDNAQFNELQVFLSLMGGGTVRPGSGGPGYHGVQSPGWAPPLYWCPEPVAADPYKARYGFPEWPGLLDRAMTPFEAPGLSVPWLSCFGNHDGLVLGTARADATYEAVLAGSRKAADLPPGLDPFSLVSDFLTGPGAMLSGPAVEVEADDGRRSITRREFVEAHLEAGGSPSGHGFGSANLKDGTAYGVFDLDGPVPVRVVMLDTTNLDGYFEGSIGARQLRWLEERLIEVHSRHYDERGRLVTTGAGDRLVVLASHHGLATMVNARQDPAGPEDDHPRATATQVEELLHRFGNVVLWLNGHRHRNDVQPRPDPSRRSAGFWEVSTASVADWPCQVRLVELVSVGRGDLSILCTMLDAAVPASSDMGDGDDWLASLHRELAANDPFAGYHGGGQGRPQDRNLALRLPAPFDFA